jgi:hypothetical protein
MQASMLLEVFGVQAIFEYNHNNTGVYENPRLVYGTTNCRLDVFVLPLRNQWPTQVRQG